MDRRLPQVVEAPPCVSAKRISVVGWSAFVPHLVARQSATGRPRANTEGKTPAAAFERSLVLLLGRMFDHFKFGVINKKSPDTLPEYLVQHWWHRARQGKLENLGKTDCLLGRWVDPELLAVSRSLEF